MRFSGKLGRRTPAADSAGRETDLRGEGPASFLDAPKRADGYKIDRFLHWTTDPSAYPSLAESGLVSPPQATVMVDAELAKSPAATSRGAAGRSQSRKVAKRPLSGALPPKEPGETEMQYRIRISGDGRSLVRPKRPPTPPIPWLDVTAEPSGGKGAGKARAPSCTGPPVRNASWTSASWTGESVRKRTQGGAHADSAAIKPR
jgi:hypothetical protein